MRRDPGKPVTLSYRMNRLALVQFELESQGNLLAPNDLLIAAHALALGAVLVTDNTREFERIQGLVIEGWL